MKNRKEPATIGSTADQMRSELKRIRYKRIYMRTLCSTLLSMLIAVALILTAAAYLPIVRITGDSMANTLNRGDILLSLRGDEVERGDLIAFYMEGNKILVKRVIACAEDMIQIEQDGTVIVNDQVMAEEYVSARALGECDQEFPLRVPRECVFVMGDNREISLDSRSSAMGCIAREQIIGKVAVRIWPLHAIGFLDKNWMK